MGVSTQSTWGFACWSLALTQVLKQLSPASAMIILAVQYEKHAEILRHYFEKEISAETNSTNNSLLTFLEEKYSGSVAEYTIAASGGNPTATTTTTAAASAARSQQTCGQPTIENNDLTELLEAEEDLYFVDEVSLRLWYDNPLMPTQDNAAFHPSISRSVIESV